MEDYRYEARDVAGFVSQIVRYVASGYFYYIRVLVPDGKDPCKVDAKVMQLYGVGGKRWRRERRNLKDSAGAHYLRCNRLAVLMLSKGRHDDFYSDHGECVQDIRRVALKVYGYSIRYGHSVEKGGKKVFVRLDQDKYRELKESMLAVCAWESFRDPKRMEREFSRLPYQPYEPVYKQLLAVLIKVNKQRRRRGFEEISAACLANKIRVGPVFVENAGEGRAVEESVALAG